VTKDREENASTEKLARLTHEELFCLGDWERLDAHGKSGPLISEEEANTEWTGKKFRRAGTRKPRPWQWTKSGAQPFRLNGDRSKDTGRDGRRGLETALRRGEWTDEPNKFVPEGVRR
jgi:hypothetical protein